MLHSKHKAQFVSHASHASHVSLVLLIPNCVVMCYTLLYIVDRTYYLSLKPFNLMGKLLLFGIHFTDEFDYFLVRITWMCFI